MRPLQYRAAEIAEARPVIDLRARKHPNRRPTVLCALHICLLACRTCGVSSYRFQVAMDTFYHCYWKGTSHASVGRRPIARHMVLPETVAPVVGVEPTTCCLRNYLSVQTGA